MAGRHPLVRLLLLLFWVSTILTCVWAQDPDEYGKPAWIYPFYQYQYSAISEFYLKDTIIATYVNCDNLTNFQTWCGDDPSRSLAGDGMWKVLEGVGYLGPNASQPVVLKKLGKDIDFVFTCGFSLSTGTQSLPWGGMFRLQNKARPGGPLTFGLDKAIAPTTTISNYKPFSTFDGEDSWKEANHISGPIEASFVALSSSTSQSTTASTASPPTATPQSTASTTSSAALQTSSEAGNIDTGQVSSAKKGGLGIGAITGISVGAAALVIGIVVLAFFLFWRRRKTRLAATSAANNAPGEGEEQGKGAAYFKAELEDNPKPHGNELDGSNEAEIKEKSHELGPGTERYELGDGGEGGLRGRMELP